MSGGLNRSRMKPNYTKAIQALDILKMRPYIIDDLKIGYK